MSACIHVQAASFLTQSGVVTRVVDGDTVWVKTSASQPILKLRIEGIDAPEICQPGGVQAYKALKQHVLGRAVVLMIRAHDDYGRSVGRLYWQGEDVGRWLVSGGHAWVDSYRNQKSPYADELADAQLARRGIFSDASAEAPRRFRKRHGSCYINPSLSYKKTSSF